MSFFSKLFGGAKSKPTEEMPAVAVECPHGVLVPRWDSVQDMGIEAKVTSFTCDACQKSFTPEEGRALRESLAERLRVPEANPET
jgi:hypothetical protein